VRQTVLIREKSALERVKTRRGERKKRKRDQRYTPTSIISKPPPRALTNPPQLPYCYSIVPTIKSPPPHPVLRLDHPIHSTTIKGLIHPPPARQAPSNAPPPHRRPLRGFCRAGPVERCLLHPPTKRDDVDVRAGDELVRAVHRNG